ncbi:type VI secretion system-associated FHA domain protein TagH [Paracoccus sp. KR1-242]|uniref:type VI secretion system-associated FHA domain protein TagH n=1 Tax=Paracoccus sp. KR1-242 TaxID=3410028 RepID=UPI003BFAD719
MAVTLRFQTTGIVPSNAQPVVLRGTALTIGRAPENDLVLPDPDRQLSKRHCTIEDQGGSFVVIDFSANGTFLNYGKIPLGRVPTPLSDGDILTLGGYELLVSVTPGASPARQDLIPDPLPDDPVPADMVPGPAPYPPPNQPAGNQFLPEDSGERDFLDDLLGAAPLRGPASVSRPKLGEDGLLPPLSPDDLEDLPDEDPSVGASMLERAAPAQDHFAAPRVRDTIPDDWDDLTEPPEPTQPDASDAAPPPADLPDPTLAEPAPEPPPPPRHLAPEPPSVTGPDAATRAFLEALGAGHMAIPDADMVAAMTRLGQAMRSMIEGLREVLMTRASIKQELSLGQTVISAGGNNPLKFSVSPGQAVEAMVFPTAPGWLPADVAATQALDDLKAHEVAMLTGIEAALKDLLRKFDPKTLESRLTAGGGIGGFIKGRKARYWEIYEAHYAEIADQAENDFQDLFAHEFARAYRKQLERLK